MRRTIRAHFNGEVFVPDEPVDLPRDEAVELTVDAARDGLPAAAETLQPESDRGGPLADFVEWLDALPAVDRGDLPTDGARNYRHYRYGHPKQP